MKSNISAVKLFETRGLGVFTVDNDNATLTRFYINGIEYSSADYEQRLLAQKQELTAVLGRDIPNIVDNYLI
jgi:hypothetical protein